MCSLSDADSESDDSPNVQQGVGMGLRLRKNNSREKGGRLMAESDEQHQGLGVRKKNSSVKKGGRLMASIKSKNFNKSKSESTLESVNCNRHVIAY